MGHDTSDRIADDKKSVGQKVLEQTAENVAGAAIGAVLGEVLSPVISKVASRLLNLESKEVGGAIGGRTLSRESFCNSFASSTPVRTLAGLVAIGALTVGTPVLAFNDSTQQNGYYPITAVHRNLDPALTYLNLKDGKSGQPEAITTTPEHPFYVQTQANTQTRPRPVGHEELNSHWVGAGHLQIGDKIREVDGTVGTVANVFTVQQTMQMFNLTVDTAHTFYVGQNGWLVHNCDLYDGLPPVLGRGSTIDPSKGRFAPRNLREQVAVEQAMSDASKGQTLPFTMTDKRWPASDGWVKKSYVVEPGGRDGPIEVHYVFNTQTKQIDDFKIIDTKKVR